MSDDRTCQPSVIFHLSSLFFPQLCAAIKQVHAVLRGGANRGAFVNCLDHMIAHDNGTANDRCLHIARFCAVDERIENVMRRHQVRALQIDHCEIGESARVNRTCIDAERACAILRRHAERAPRGHPRRVCGNAFVQQCGKARFFQHVERIVRRRAIRRQRNRNAAREQLGNRREAVGEFQITLGTMDDGCACLREQVNLFVGDVNAMHCRRFGIQEPETVRVGDRREPGFLLNEVYFVPRFAQMNLQTEVPLGGGVARPLEEFAAAQERRGWRDDDSDARVNVVPGSN